MPLAIIEVNNELGQSSDSLLQGNLYYALLATEQQRRHPLQRSAWPMLLLEVVGPLLRVSGCVHTTRTVCEPFTAMLNLLEMHSEQPDQVCDATCLQDTGVCCCACHVRRCVCLGALGEGDLGGRLLCNSFDYDR